MKSEITCEEFIYRSDEFIGRDIESVEQGKVYRGPISKIERKGGMVYIYTKWTARYDPEWPYEGWERFNSFPYRFDEDSWNRWGSVREDEDGHIHMSMPMIGYAEIIVASNLDPREVRGLET